MSTPYESAPSEELTALHAQVRHYQSELSERDTVIAQRDAMIEHLQEQVRSHAGAGAASYPWQVPLPVL